MPNFYQKSTVVVVPSVTPESFGMVGIEAMSYGKPVLAFDVGGISEWLKHEETGFLLKPRDEQDLAEKLNLLLGDRTLAVSMGTKGRERVETYFTPENHVTSLLDSVRREIAIFQKRPPVSARP